MSLFLFFSNVFFHSFNYWNNQFTKKRADELKLFGWVRNEPGGTIVTGAAQGSPENVSLM